MGVEREGEMSRKPPLLRDRRPGASPWHCPGESGTGVAIWRETPHTAEKEKRHTLASLFLPPSRLLPVPSIGGISWKPVATGTQETWRVRAWLGLGATLHATPARSSHLSFFTCDTGTLTWRVPRCGWEEDETMHVTSRLMYVNGRSM